MNKLKTQKKNKAPAGKVTTNEVINNDHSLELVNVNSPRGRLQQAAASLFKAKGFSRTTVRDIAANVGIQSGSIFHHFKNKEQILQSVMNDAILRVMTSMQQKLTETTHTSEQLYCLVLCELQAIHDEELAGFQLLISEWRSLNDENQQKILNLRQQYESLWLKVLDQAQHENLVNVDSFYLRGFIRGALIETGNWYKLDGDVTLETLAQKLMTAFIRQGNSKNNI